MELPKLRNEDSVRDLFKDLGEIYTDNSGLARDVTYTHLFRENCIKNEDKVHWREDFANYCYNLRYNGFYDDTNILEDAVLDLEDKDEHLCDGLMKFLTLLSGSEPHTRSPGLLPVLPPEPQPHHIHPPPHHYHGDSHVTRGASAGYVMYREELFTRVAACPGLQNEVKALSTFPSNKSISRFIRPAKITLPPKVTMSGEPIRPPGILSQNRILTDLPPLPAPSIKGIFKSLSQKEDDPPLQTGPVLRSNIKQRFHHAKREIQSRFEPVRKAIISLSQDSGTGSYMDEERSWEEAYRNMEVQLPTPTYELLGRKIKQERPYLTESGREVYSRLCVLLCSPYNDIYVVTEQQVLYQAQFVLLGIPTAIFEFDEIDVEFVPLKNISFTGVSPDSLVDCLFSIAYTGTLYLRLKMFCDQYRVVEKYGNIAKAVVSAVEQYLYLYQAFLNHVPIKSLIELVWKTKDMTSQLEFLCNLLLLEEGLPKGSHLIEYLFETAEMLISSPYYRIILAVIRAALKPYSKYLELWLCEGRVWDDWNEFHILPHREWMTSRDYLFWQYAFTENEGGKLPTFLSELREQLINTGKLINLLKVCVPDHPILQSKFRPPKLHITFSYENIEELMGQWKLYEDCVYRELKTRATIRDLKIRLKTEARIEKLVEAKEDAKRRINMIMEEASSLIKTEKEKKRGNLERLQDQMLEHAEQRLVLIEQEKEEDKQRIETNETQQYQLIEDVRTQLEDYYSALTTEQAREERKSRWRIQRMKLTRLRRAFLLLEMEKLNEELRETISRNKVINSDEASHQTGSIRIKMDLSKEDNNVSVSEVRVEENEVNSNSESSSVQSNSAIGESGEADLIANGENNSVEENINNEEMVSDNDSEISFSVSPKSQETEQIEERKFEPDGEMKQLLYPEENLVKISDDDGSRDEKQTGKVSDDEGSSSESTKDPVPSAFEPQGQMKELLYGSETTQSLTNETEEPQGQMKELLYGSETTPSPTNETEEPQGQMKELLYGSETTPPLTNETGDKIDEKETGKVSDSEGNSVKPALGAFEPQGQMKELLYGSEASSSLTKEAEDKTEDKSEDRTGDESEQKYGRFVASKRAQKVDRMKEILYEQFENEENESEIEASRPINNNSFNDQDSGIVSDFHTTDPIRLTYPELDSKPDPNIMIKRLTKYYVPEKSYEESEVDNHRSLEIILKRLLERPLLLQMDLVNKAAVHYFVEELKIKEYFEALRSYVCMYDGMFGEALSKGIFNMIDSGMDLTSSPAVLNSVLHDAMECSKVNNHISLQSIGNQVGGDVLNSLILKYDIEWPINIIITDNMLFKYNEIFKFLLKLKHGCFMLDKIWFILRSTDKKGRSPQLREIQVFRYEVSQCLHAVQIYMTHQLHNISWHELQQTLQSANSVSQLQQAHETYLDNALERLLLGETTRTPYEIILKLFKHVTLFLGLLQSGRFYTDLEGNLVHSEFDKLMQRHYDFKKQAVFILKVAESSNSSGYKPYIDEFTLRLDFNHYYQSSNPIAKRKSMAGLNLLSRSNNSQVEKSRLVNSLSSPSTNRIGKSF